ncbi:MAG: OmpA family protein [Kiritimatiellaeota bacterium]|nr:OmpA family protein [Kiritimatiellota bacterium]
MDMRFAVVANVALACVLLGLSTGCSKNKKSDGEYVIPTGAVDIENPFGDGMGLDGIPVGAIGGRFEDMCDRVTDITFAPIYFAFDSYALAPQEIAKIEQVARHLQSNSRHVLVIEGHCDIRGSNEYNLALGENRALAVRTHLVHLGVGPERIQTRSFGSEKPAVAGTGEAVWRLNRRGEFALYQK